jgi:hypothetical protein
VAITAISLLSGVAIAQIERPEITPRQQRAAQKKDLGPRAVGLLQLGERSKSSLVPIAIMINGKFWDASVYKADPVPMALDSGTVYEVERCGSSQGLFTVNGALHRTVANAPNPWIGTGSWVPNGTVIAKTTHKAEITPVGMETNDEPPRLTRSRESGGENASKPTESAGTASPSSASPTKAAGPSTQPSSSSPSSNPPKKASSGDGGSAQPVSNSPSSSSTGSKAPSAPEEDKGGGDSKPADSKSTPAKAAEPAVPASDSGASEENRPRLRRGKPTESLPGDDEVEGYGKPGESAPTSSLSAPSAAKSGMKPDQPPVQLIPAISDAGGPEPHSYTFDWIKGEEQDRQQQMTVMAKQQLRAYLTAQAKATIPVKSETRARRRPAKEEEPVLENVKMTAYDLWTSNQPVIVFSAEAHVPTSSAEAPSDNQAGLEYSILLVAYPDIYNNLHKLYAGVTDKYHLDVTPRLELIDAVDADGDGFGELLFRETSDAGTGWVIYRATADKLWKMFDSLNPE